MKRNFLCLLTIVMLAVSLSGCEKLMEFYGIREKSSSKAKQEILSPVEEKKVKDEDLAKILLKPEHHTISVKSDPFRPLQLTKVSVGEKKDEVHVDIVLLGVIKLDNTYSALLKTPTEKNVCKVGDKIGTFKVKSITADYVVVTDGKQDIKLERGK